MSSAILKITLRNLLVIYYTVINFTTDLLNL